METKLKKFDVCDRCYSVGILDPNCNCSFTNFHTINLEFEVCGCCGNVVTDGQPADTEYNITQIKNHKENKK